jgi:hypothetical protein
MTQRKLMPWTATFATLLLLAGTAQSASPECHVVPIKADGEVSGLEPEATGIRLVAGETQRAIEGAAPQGGVWRVTKAQFDLLDTLVRSMPDTRRRAARLVQTRNGRDMVPDPLQFLLDGEAASRACGATPVAAAGGAEPEAIPAGSSGPATAEQCKQAAKQWSGRYLSPVLFNSRGVHCYSPPVIRQGDLLQVGMVLNKGETLPGVPSVDFRDCPPESPTPEVLANGEIPHLQAATRETAFRAHYLDARACGSVSPIVTVKLGEGEGAVSNPYTLTQYKRYRATFHLGALYTDLHDPDFALRNDGTSDLIYDKEANERGPEYLAALIVPGLAYYVEDLFEKLGKNPDTSDPSTWGYKGYDPIHDRTWKDKLGLVITAGIEDPGDRFGLGLSYEIAYGINLVAVYEMAKVKQLSGFAIGDPFTGTADQIPTDQEWDSKFSIGLTFDLAYVTKLFSGATTGG